MGRILSDVRKGETAELAGKVGKKQAKLVGEIIPASLVIRRFYKDHSSTFSGERRL